MSAESTLYDSLRADAAVLAFVEEGDDSPPVARIYPDLIPLASGTPAVAIARVDTEFVTTVKGAVLGSTSTLEATCIAQKRTQADGLADAVNAAAAAAGFVPVGRQGQMDPETDLWATVLTFTFNE